MAFDCFVFVTASACRTSLNKILIVSCAVWTVSFPTFRDYSSPPRGFGPGSVSFYFVNPVREYERRARSPVRSLSLFLPPPLLFRLAEWRNVPSIDEPRIYRPIRSPDFTFALVSELDQWIYVRDTGYKPHTSMRVCGAMIISVFTNSRVDINALFE